MSHSLLQNRKGACTLVDLYGIEVAFDEAYNFSFTMEFEISSNISLGVLPCPRQVQTISEDSQ